MTSHASWKKPTHASTLVSHRVQLHAECLESRDVPSVAGADAISEFSNFAYEPGKIGDPLLAHPRGRFVVSSTGGQPSAVNVYDAETNALLGIITPFGSGYTGSIRAATGDVTGDGIEDIIVATGPDSVSRVAVYDGANLVQRVNYEVYSADYTGGTYLAVGDVTGDGRADIVTGTGVGGGPHVKIFDGRDLFPGGDVQPAVQPFARESFFAYDSDFRGGVSVAVGDMDGDGQAEIITGAGIGGGPHVKVFSGKGHTELQSFFAYDSSYRGGVFVASGDFNMDGRAEIVTSAMQGGGPIVRIFDHGSVTDITPFDENMRSGFPIAVQNIDGDTADELIVATGPGVAPEVKVIDFPGGKTVRTFPAFSSEFMGGLFVG